MKTILATLCLLTISFAPTALADCTVLDTGGQVCADVAGASNFSASASQSGAGGAQADAYEFSFFGQTYRGKNVFVYTDPSGPAGYNSVSFSEFCFATPSGCAFQDDSVFVTTQAGSAYVGVSQGPDGRLLCFAAADQFGCQAF